MAGRPLRVLGRLTVACPICVTPEGTLMQAGVQAGALVLVAVTVLVVTPMAWFGLRLWRRERGDR